MNRLHVIVTGVLVSILPVIGMSCGKSRDHVPAEFRDTSRPTDSDQTPRSGESDETPWLFRWASTEEQEALLDGAEKEAGPDGRQILATARKMIANREIVLGSCWDYINALYDRASVTSRKRMNAFNAAKPGPFADVAQIQPGDWLYYINHSFGDVEHSAVFVTWLDYETKEALMISYAGGNSHAPARYKEYDLSSVYQIIRPRPGI